MLRNAHVWNRISDTLNIAKEAVGDMDTIVIGDIGPVADGPDTCYYPSYLARFGFQWNRFTHCWSNLTSSDYDILEWR